MAYLPGSVAAKADRVSITTPGRVIRKSETIQPGEGVAVAVTLAAGMVAIWALVVITLQRRASSRPASGRPLLAIPPVDDSSDEFLVHDAGA